MVASGFASFMKGMIALASLMKGTSILSAMAAAWEV
jgi:hypothetical protein